MAESLIRNVWLIPFLPLLGGLIALIGGRWLRGWNHLPVIAGIATSFVLSSIVLLGAEEPAHVIVYRWIEINSPSLPDQWSLSVPIEMRLDGLTTMMLGMVTFVSTLVAIFAAGYMKDDPGYPRFFFAMGLFVFSMTGLVLSSNFVLTYAFWEGVGVCSYLLIGFWYARTSAAEAAKKAFLVNRIGDFGFAIALFWLWTVVPNHDLSYDNVLSEPTLALLTPTVKTGIALLLFWAATAKSAQIPLYVWLPDAMEGPTPVSALIHAATMVTAGVYLIARSSLLMVQVPEVQLVVCLIGCATALLASLIALTQVDLKRVLAYSTVSQLGYMFMALGAGAKGVAAFAIVAGLFHLFTHAFFKALLFLGSGSVMHSMGNVVDMRRFRGLRHRLPITCWTFAVGAVALAGIPPFAGFWSKDEILASLKEASHAAAPGGFGAAYIAIYWIATFTAFLTAFYTGRAFFMTFFGPEKLPSPDDPEVAEHLRVAPAPARAAMGVDTPAPDSEELTRYEQAMGTHRPTPEPPSRESHQIASEHAVSPTQDVAVPHLEEGHPGHAPGHGDEHDHHFGHESPPIMTVPLIVLAVCAALVGLIFGPTHWFAHHIEETPTFSVLDAAATGAEAEHSFDWATAIVGSLVGVLGLALSWWMYAKPSDVPDKVASTIRPFYQASWRKFYVDELYGLIVVGPSRLLASASAFFDSYVIDGLVRLVAFVPRLIGRDAIRPFQNGLIQSYAVVTALGIALLLLVLLIT